MTGRGLALAAVLGAALAGCVPGFGPFVLGPARGRVTDEDTGEPIRDAEVIEWWRGAGSMGGPQPVYHARSARTGADGRFAFDRSVAPSPRMWFLKTYGPAYSFYHPSYGLEHGGGPPETGAEIELRGSLRRSEARLADVAPLCRGRPDDPGGRRLAEVACPVAAHAAYPDGSPRAIGARDPRGRRTGMWTFYYEDGSVAARGEYRDGAPIGAWEFRDRAGARVRPAPRPGIPPDPR